MSSEIGETSASVSWFKYLAEDASSFFTRQVSFYVDDEDKLAYCFYNHERGQGLAKLRILGDAPPKNKSLQTQDVKYLGWHPSKQMWSYCVWLSSMVVEGGVIFSNAL
ncbi:unnamed protein product [Microthlaspi erraticum]|uniref:Uncharacterized protein n=1 Tax=Microthlaspi erraticum TaxID=1685480 RepID=A0A6D2JVB6_9BRAS|nr:unnamed protein product [Microthlaspi erraticum]